LPAAIRKPVKHIKKLHELAVKNTADIWFLDECHFQQRGSRETMWIPWDVKDPIVFHAPTRKSVGYFGAVRVDDGKLVTMSAHPFNADTFKGFLECLILEYRTGRKMIVVLDNARYHHARCLNEWREENEAVLRLDFLPPYSPDLNHIERVWKLTRRKCLHNRYFPSLNEMVQILESQFHQWKVPNQTLHQLCAII